ncbi:DUF4870 domain-containing protein [Sinomicrobium sp. M5D2P17]
MNEIGLKIKESRKKKGLSQEELAEAAKVNLRTIQRIENNQNEPRGKTLSLICEVLEINVEDVLDYGKHTDRKYLVYFHLSVLTFLAIPLGNIILPLILWLTKKDKIIGLKEIGANVLNFQITWTICIGLAIIGHIIVILRYGIRMEFLYVFLALYVINMILPVAFAIKTRNGQTKEMYPTFIKLVS